MDASCRIDLFDGLRATLHGRSVTRFRTQRTGSLLGYLALHKDRAHPRDVLVELLWPDGAPELGRHSLSTALSSLRHQLEPPGASLGSVLIADRLTVRLRENSVSSDVSDFNAFLQAASEQNDPSRRMALLEQAVDLYKGDLLAGYYDDWVVTEQPLWLDRLLGAVATLTDLAVQTGDVERAIEYARRGIQADPGREETHLSLMRLYTAAGRHADVVRQHERLCRVLTEELDAAPGPVACSLVANARAALRASPSVEHIGGHTPTAIRRRAPERRRSAAPASSRSHCVASVVPARWTTFIGREAELARLQDLLRPIGRPSEAHVRLVTLTGSGGSGKTRLAAEAAAQAARDFADAVWFVPLADITDSGMIADAILRTMGIERSSGQESLDVVAEALSRQSSLLVLDNFEQLVAATDPAETPAGTSNGAGALLVRALLVRCDTLMCLVTSRQPLGLTGERDVHVLPLPVPGGATELERVAHCESVRLFVDRAQAVRPDFQLTNRNSRSVAELCDCLEGIPLAIELAAARSQVLTPAQMLVQLEDRFGFLVSRRRDTEARHRTLRASIDWSYRMLAPELQRFFARVSVFRGGWSAKAAELVCDQPLALDYLAQLTECSLVETTDLSDAIRFSCLETLREYAIGHTTPEERATARRLHARYYAELAEREAALLTGPGQGRALAVLDAEIGNMRAALAWCLEPPYDACMGLRLAGALWRYWRTRGYWAEGLKHLEASLECPGADDCTTERASALSGAGNLARWMGDRAAACAYFEASLKEFRTLGDNRGQAGVLNNLGTTLRERGSLEEARAALTAALEVNRALGNDAWEAINLTNLGLVATDEASWPEAEGYFETALVLWRAMNDKLGLANMLSNYGMMLAMQGHPTRAQQLCAEALVIQDELGDASSATYTLITLGRAATDLGDHSAARSRLSRALTSGLRLRDRFGVVFALRACAGLAASEGRWQSVARWIAAAGRLAETLGTPLPTSARDQDERCVNQSRAALGEARFACAWGEGRLLAWEAAVEGALTHCDGPT